MKAEKSGHAKHAKIAVIRVRGRINLSEELKKTFEMLNLHNKNWCVVLNDSPSVRGMLKKVKDYVTWGEISESTYNELIQKRGEKYKERTEDSRSKIQYKKYIIYNNEKYKRFFRLNPPKKGYGRKGIKASFNNGGALGYRAEKINDLLQRMM